MASRAARFRREVRASAAETEGADGWGKCEGLETAIDINQFSTGAELGMHDRHLKIANRESTTILKGHGFSRAGESPESS
jgi:hypothetical protein